MATSVELMPVTRRRDYERQGSRVSEVYCRDEDAA